MVARYKAGTANPDGGSAPERKARRKAARKIERRKLREANGDGRHHNGRPPARRNRLPTSIKLAILGAMEQLGDCSGKDAKSGEGGIMAYWVNILSYDVRINKGTLSVQLASRLLPPPKTPGVDSDPSRFTIPLEVLKDFKTDELRVIERMFNRVADLAAAKVGPEGDADDYARSIGMLPSPENMKVINQ